MSEIFIKNAEALCKALGVKVADLKKEDANVSELAKGISDGIVENNKSDIEIEAKKTATAAAYNKLQKQLANAFDLDPKQYESMTKGQLDAMLEDAKAKVSDKGGDKGGDKSTGKDADELNTLKRQLAEAEAMRKAANDELKSLRQKAEEIPTLLETHGKKIKTQYEYEKHVSNTIKELRDKGLRKDITDNMIKAELFSGGIDLEPQEIDGNIIFKVSKVTKSADGQTIYKPISKSASEAYNSLSEYALDKVVKEEWLSKTAAPNQPLTQGNSGKDISLLLPPELL